MSAFSEEVSKRLDRLNQITIERSSMIIDISEQIKILLPEIKSTKQQCDMVYNLMKLEKRLTDSNKELVDVKEKFKKVIEGIK